MRIQTAVRLALGAVSVSAIGTGCIPYAVGSTARPATQGQTRFTFSSYALPRTLELQKPPKSGTKIGMDIEARRGISDRADLGIRIPSISGAILTYKRRLDGVSYKSGAGIAAQVGGGVLSYGSHGELEATVIASGDEKGLFTSYGGLRGVYTVPLMGSYDKDDPVYGGFLGMRLGTSDFGMSVELGVFRDRSQYPTDKRNVAIVPSISFHGDLLEMLNIRRGRGQR